MNAYPLTLLYDGACPVCRLEIDRLRADDAGQLLRFIDISVPDFDAARYGAPLADMLESIHAMRADGNLIKGVEVLQLAYAAIGLGWMVRPVGWPIVKPILERVYLCFARNRYALSKKFAWLLYGIAARRALHRTRACKNGKCEL